MAFKLVIITAPSGAGKTTIVRHLLSRFDKLAFSISATTRPQRAQEKDGKDYYFLDREAFRQRIARNDFVEWEEVYPDQYYGTLKAEVERLWGQGKHIIFDIDVKGALSIIGQYPEESLSLFIRPPSLGSLRQRLAGRDTEDDDSIRKRLDRARMELSFAGDFDHTIVNDDLDRALAEAEHLVGAFLEEETP